jgi:hypothetical protein
LDYFKIVKIILVDFIVGIYSKVFLDLTWI